jgi:tRNA modification GTPase
MRNTRYDVNDTIVAISSPPNGARTIVRISGPAVIETCKQIFSRQMACFRPNEQSAYAEDFLKLNQSPNTESIRENFTTLGYVKIDDELEIEAQLYLFFSPRSYTGDDLAELHLETNCAVIEALVSKLLAMGLRGASPGEFTARAYLNGKIDLAQAEAVNEVILSSNRLQLTAAEKLLEGQLGQTINKVTDEIIDCLSLIEAGLDFSGEDTEFISAEQAAERLSQIKQELSELLRNSIRFESVVDLPAVGIAGAPNAGKSSLLNKLLGTERSIVSHQSKTTRDVLTGLLTLRHYQCVLFDCAGLIVLAENVLDELTQQAATEALHNSNVVIFCVDASKPDWSEDVSIRQLIEPKVLIPAATKVDLLSQAALAKRLDRLKSLFDSEFLPISVKTGAGLQGLRDIVDRKLIEMFTGTKYKSQDTIYEIRDTSQSLTLTARHRQAVSEAIDNINLAIDEVKTANDEVAAMLLRTAFQSICDIKRKHVDEQILEAIFSRFCIGK